MTTATRPIPAHGTEARYQGALDRPGCRCRKCVTGWTRAGQKRLLARMEGRPASTDSAPVTAHIAFLHDNDMTTGQIAAAAGVDPSTVRDHARAAFPKIRRTTANKILAVRPRQYVGYGFVSALGSLRRCRALYAAGHGPHAIAAAVPELQVRTVEYITDGTRQSVSVANHQAIAQSYRQLASTTGNAVRARNRAQAGNWPGPDYWDEGDFDNPDFVPAVIVPPRYIVLAENGLELERHGHTREQAAERLGTNKINLQQAIGRYRKAQEAAA